MAGKPQRKEPPLSMRLPEADIAIIDRAAQLRGRSRTDFVRDAAVGAAEDVLMATVPLRMSAEGFDALLSVLSEPAEAVAEMREISSERHRGRRARHNLPISAPEPIASRHGEAAAFWRRCGFTPSKDDPLMLFRSIADIAASLGRF